MVEEQKLQIRKDYIENFMSLNELCKKYNIKSKSYLSYIIGKDNIRCQSDANKLAHKKYPDSFKHTDEVKDKIRVKRIEYLKNNQDKTAWRNTEMSHPEKCFQKILEDNGIDKKCLIYREYSVFPYFIDFAFINEKIAVEIDGSQHLQEEYMKRDKLKDELLISKGWKVIRIAAIEVIRDGTNALNAINEALERKHTRWCNKSWDIKSTKNT